jgi:hypothetical protein
MLSVLGLAFAIMVSDRIPMTYIRPYDQLLSACLPCGITEILLTGTVAGPQHCFEYCLDQWWTRHYHLGCKWKGQWTS